MDQARPLRDVFDELVGDDAARHAYAADPGGYLSAQGHPDLPEDLVAQAVVDYAAGAPPAVAEQLAPYVTAHAPGALDDGPEGTGDPLTWLAGVEPRPIDDADDDLDDLDDLDLDELDLDRGDDGATLGALDGPEHGLDDDLDDDRADGTDLGLDGTDLDGTDGGTGLEGTGLDGTDLHGTDLDGDLDGGTGLDPDLAVPVVAELDAAEPPAPDRLDAELLEDDAEDWSWPDDEDIADL